jgi:hypothetical protein
MLPRPTHLDILQANPVLQQRLAKYLVLWCVRNSCLEDLHAGIAPSSATGDYADVTVTSPFGTIPWPRLSRFNDDEMKQLMIDIVDRTYQLLHMVLNEHTGRELLNVLSRQDPAPRWHAPRLTDTC